MKEKIIKIFNESIEVKTKTLDRNLDKIISAVKEINKAVKKSRKILLFGNGGSAADSQHIAAEFIGRFKKERRAVGAIALTTDTSCLTALGNDYSFDIIFSRQIEGLGKKGDIAIGISTSGSSKNVIEGIKKAKSLGLKTITLTGCDGGRISKVSDISIVVPSKDTARIQESHSCIAHAICELVENSI